MLPSWRAGATSSCGATPTPNFPPGMSPVPSRCSRRSAPTTSVGSRIRRVGARSPERWPAPCGRYSAPVARPIGSAVSRDRPRRYTWAYSDATGLRRSGLFDESLLRNQDYELNHRIAAGGGLVYFDPELRVTYQPRDSWTGLWRQYWQYGAWKRVVARRHPESVRLRQLIPVAFVVGLGVSAGLALAGHRRLGCAGARGLRRSGVGHRGDRRPACRTGRRACFPSCFRPCIWPGAPGSSSGHAKAEAARIPPLTRSETPDYSE